jgi:hypothetical protein
LHNHITCRLFRRAIDRPALIIDAIAERPPGNGTNSAADESTAESVAAAAVIADDRASKRTEGATGDRTLLGVGSRANASGEKDGNGQNQKR